MICASVMCRAASRAGSTSTWSWRSAWPNVDTSATPDTPSSRGTIVHRASTDKSIWLSWREVSPMSITLPVDDTGCSSTGGLDTFGSTNAWVSRSCTSWRAWYRLVPGAKSRLIWDSPGIESDVTSVTPITPSSRFFSSGTVTRDSTSGAERPGASVWIRAVTGAVSGSTSA